MAVFKHQIYDSGPGLRRRPLVTQCTGCLWFAAGTNETAIEVAEHAHLCRAIPKKPPASVTKSGFWDGLQARLNRALG